MDRVNANPLRDSQDQPPAAYCHRCGGELYSPGQGCRLCADCREELHPTLDQETVLTVLEGVDRELVKYLSSGLKDAIWNTLSKRYLKEGA